MHNDPQVLIQNGGIPNFRPRKTLLSLAKAMFLLFRCPSLLGSVYTSTFFPDLRLCSAVLCEFGTDRARNMEALLRKTTPRQVLHVLVRRKVGGSAMPRRPLILCVDDELNGLEGRKMLLEEAGFKVLVATSGADALQLLPRIPSIWCYSITCLE